MRPGIRRIEFYRRTQLLEGSGLFPEIVPGRTQPVMRISPPRFEPQRGLELLRSLFCVAAVFQRESQVVVGRRIVRFKGQSLAIICDCLLPGFRSREFNCPSTITLGSLSKRWRCE